MNEQTNQNADLGGQAVEDDPLAELARIVAGEPELGGQDEPNLDGFADELAGAISPEGAAEVSSDMEAALEASLLQELSAQDLGVETPEFVEDINATIDEITNSASTADQVEPSLQTIVEPFPEPMPEPLPEPTPEPTPEPMPETLQEPIAQTADPDVPNTTSVENEVDFQDDLISALEGELAGHKAEIEPALEPETSMPEVETLPETVVEPQLIEEEVPVATELTLEEELAASLSEMEESEALEIEQAIEPDQIAEANTLEAASLEDDLGEAFANEFEQINAQHEIDEANLDIVEPQAENIVEAAIEAPVEHVAEEHVQQEVVEEVGDPDLEMDFEAAFTQELQVSQPISASAVEGMTAVSDNVASLDVNNPMDSMTTSADMTAMEQAIANNLPDDLDFTDPGHAGSIDEISAIEAANEDTNAKGGGMKYAAAALILALFAGTIVTGYGFLGGDNSLIASGTPTIIKADVGDVKIKPDDPGGIVPENQDNASYTDIGGENNVEVSQKELVSTTEEPATLNTQVVGVQPKSDDRLFSSEDEGATPSAPAPSVLPKVVETVVVKPDGTILTNPVKPKPVEVTANTSAIDEASRVPIIETVEATVVETPVSAKPQSIDGAVSTGNVDVPTASPLPKPVIKPKPAPVKKVVAAKPKPKPAPVARKSEWVVQVSSQRSAEAAQQSFNTMRSRFSALQGRAMSIQRANVNGSTFFRVRVQTASRSDANQLCNRLTSAGGNCFVTR